MNYNAYTFSMLCLFFTASVKTADFIDPNLDMGKRFGIIQSYCVKNKVLFDVHGATGHQPSIVTLYLDEMPPKDLDCFPNPILDCFFKN